MKSHKKLVSVFSNGPKVLISDAFYLFNDLFHLFIIFVFFLFFFLLFFCTALTVLDQELSFVKSRVFVQAVQLKN